MPTPVKAQLIDELAAQFKENSAIYFVNYKGTTVSQADQLRNLFREEGITYRVTKNTLTRLAANKAEYTDIDEFFNGQIGIAYCKEDPGAPARIIKTFNKEVGSLEVVGALIEGQRYGADSFDELANLPTRLELVAKFLGCLNHPMSTLVATLNGAMSKLVGTLDSLKENKA